MTDFKVEQSGWYRTRDGRDAEVVVNDLIHRNVCGYIVGNDDWNIWAKTGRHFNPLAEHALDLVEYLGKERPKRKKTVKMAPALTRFYDDYSVTTLLYSSKEEAEAKLESSFIRWLIDSHAVEVEVKR